MHIRDLVDKLTPKPAMKSFCDLEPGEFFRFGGNKLLYMKTLIFIDNVYVPGYVQLTGSVVGRTFKTNSIDTQLVELV